MADTQVFGRNHAMQEILGKAKDEDFWRLHGQLINFLREIRAVQLSEDQSKLLIKSCNEIVYRLNKEIRADDTSSGISRAGSWLLKRRTSNPED
jgi:hypothetical protein